MPLPGFAGRAARALRRSALEASGRIQNSGRQMLGSAQCRSGNETRIDPRPRLTVTGATQARPFFVLRDIKVVVYPMRWLMNISRVKARAVMTAAAISLLSATALGAMFLSSSQSQAATLYDVLVTPEGTTIEMYTTRVSAQTIYDTFQRNGLDAQVGKTLTVRVYDSGGTGATLGVGLSPDGDFTPTAYIGVAADYFLRHPNFVVGHEYGHVWGHYYRWTIWNGSWDTYLLARDLYGDPRLDSSYRWRITEILAEDYRQLLAAPEAWSELPDQLNKEIPLASEVPALQDFFCTTFQGKTSNDWFRCSGDPAPEPRPEPTAEPTPEATPAPTPEPTPPPPDDGSETVTLGPGWRSFVAPISGATDVTVYWGKRKTPVDLVVSGQTYKAKGPVTITITP